MKTAYQRLIAILLTIAMVSSLFLSGCSSLKRLTGGSSRSKSSGGSSSEEITLKGDFRDAGFTQTDVDSATVQWICATYAIYTEYNNKELGIVGGVLPADKDVCMYAIKEALSSGWGIEEREDVAPVLNKLLKEGHRKTYAETIKSMETDGLLKLSETDALAKLPQDEDLYRYQAAYRAYEAYGSHGIDGWDYCRALQILGDCYQADYINLEECLNLSLPIAQTLQKAFDSWNDVAASYLYGYQFWKKENADVRSSDTAFRREIYTELAQMDDGPYTVPYDTTLKNTWANAEIETARQKKTDAEAGYQKLIYDEQLFVKIKTPQDYEEVEYSDEEQRIYSRDRSEGYGSTEITYNLKENWSDAFEYESDRVDTMIETISANSDYTDIVKSEVSERTVGDLTVSYIIYSYTYNNSLKIRAYKSWTELDKNRLLECEVEETAEVDSEFESSEDGAILDWLYGDVQY